MTKLILPISFDIKATQLANGQWQYDYIEKFNPEDYEAFKESFDGLKLIFPCILNKEESQIEIHTITNREQVFNSLASEFLINSELGMATLGELLCSIIFKSLPPPPITLEAVPKPD